MKAGNSGRCSADPSSPANHKDDEREHELAYEDFVRARKQHWRPGEPGADVLGSDHPEPANADRGFILYSSGPQGMTAVFEESGKAGWFYLYDAGQRSIVKGTHIYDRADVAVEDDVVDIGWADDDSACGLALWGQFRAFLGVLSDLEIRKRVMHSDDVGIPANEWPSGFGHYLDKKIE